MVKRRISFRRVLSSFHRIVTYQFFLALVAIALSLSSCYNEPEFIGKNLLPISDLKSVKLDTSFEVSAYTVKTDTIPTGLYSTAVLGCYNSKIFGKTKADFLSQLLIVFTTDTVLKKTSPRPEPDSLILYMPLSRTWGTKNEAINVKVYELSDTLNYKIYYNGLASVDGKYYPTQINVPTIYKGEDTLKIRFTNEFAHKLINADTSELTSNAKFLKFMNGLYITSDDYNGPDGVLYFFKSGMLLKLYYDSHEGGVKHDTVFTYGTGSGRYNHFIHEFNPTVRPDLQIQHFNDTTFQDSVFYISGLGGARGLIKLDGVSEWTKKMPIAINRAELRIDVQDHPDFPKDSIISPLLYYYNRDTDTSSLKSYRATSAYDIISLYDYSITQVQTSKYNKAKKYYSIDVTFHLQNLLKGKIKRDYFYLEPNDFKVNYKEGIFKSGKNSNRIKLIITYSKL